MLEDMVKATENELLYPIEVVVNEEKVVFDVPPRILNGRTLIPVRSVFESLGAEVLWDESAKTVTILKEAKSIKLKVESNWVHVDEKQVEIDIPVSIINGRTMVPVRFIAEELGFEVTWDGEKRVVFIKTEN
jgi:hypothetical protein